MKSEIKQIDGRFSFSNYYECFIDMIIRRLYLSGKPLTNERIGYLKDFKDILFGLEYNPISASKGIFNKGFSVSILILGLKLSDGFIRILFKIREWL